jgi:hypothetical protein
MMSPVTSASDVKMTMNIPHRRAALLLLGAAGAPHAPRVLPRRVRELRGAGARWTDAYRRRADTRRTNSARSRLKRSAAW